MNIEWIEATSDNLPPIDEPVLVIIKAAGGLRVTTARRGVLHPHSWRYTNGQIWKMFPENVEVTHWAVTPCLPRRNWQPDKDVEIVPAMGNLHFTCGFCQDGQIVTSVPNLKCLGWQMVSRGDDCKLWCGSCCLPRE